MRYKVQIYGQNGYTVFTVRPSGVEHFRRVMRQTGNVYRPIRSPRRELLVGPSIMPYKWINEREKEREKESRRALKSWLGPRYA